MLRRDLGCSSAPYGLDFCWGEEEEEEEGGGREEEQQLLEVDKEEEECRRTSLRPCG
jgi:hypothetical protein